MTNFTTQADVYTIAINSDMTKVVRKETFVKYIQPSSESPQHDCLTQESAPDALPMIAVASSYYATAAEAHASIIN